MRKLFFTIPVVLALLISAVFSVQNVMAAATATWTCVTGGATVTWSGNNPGDDIFVTSPAGTTYVSADASGTRTFLNGNDTYTFTVARGGYSSSITCTTTTTTTTTNTDGGDDDSDGVSNDKDECPKDKNAKKDKNGYCPSDETGKRLTNGSIVVYDMNDSTEIQFYTGDGKKIGGVDQSWLEDFASSQLGTTINLPTRDGKSVSLTNAGNGWFSGKYDGKDFSFYLPGLVKKSVCDEAALARAKARLDAAELTAAAKQTVAGDLQARADALADAAGLLSGAADGARAVADDAQRDADNAKEKFRELFAVVLAEESEAVNSSFASYAAYRLGRFLGATTAALGFDDNVSKALAAADAADAAQARAAAANAAEARSEAAAAQRDANAADKARAAAANAAEARSEAAAAQRDANAAQAVYDSLKKNCP